MTLLVFILWVAACVAGAAATVTAPPGKARFLPATLLLFILVWGVALLDTSDIIWPT